jgi:hypothetical protein
MAVLLVFGPVHLLMADGARAAQIAGSNGHEAALVRERIAQPGAGAEVKLKLKDGKKLKGTTGEAGEECFAFEQAGTSGRTIEYGDVSEVKPAKLSYKANGQPDAAAGSSSRRG